MDTSAGMRVLEIADLRRRVSEHVMSVIEQQTPLMLSVSSDLSPMIDSITALMAGGKRLRPAFAYWGWRGAGGTDCDEAVAAATALEFLQACALIHDDVMDGSDTRRGLPAVHRRFESLHGEHRWHGDAGLFGVGAAILAGDLCLSWADEVLMKCGLPADAVARGKQVYDIMRSELMAGQYLDLLEQSRSSADVERIRNVIRFKSAKYTIERPLHMGAALAGADEAVMRQLSDFGLPLGEAFQLRDDVLGVFGDPEVTGKPAGDDLREGKRTALIAYAFERASANERGLLAERLGRQDLSAQDIDDMRSIIVSCGALDIVETLISEGRDAALQALSTSSLTPEAVHVLGNLAVAAADRKF